MINTNPNHTQRNEAGEWNLRYAHHYLQKGWFSNILSSYNPSSEASFEVFVLLGDSWVSHLPDLLSLRLDGAVGVGNYVISSFSQWALTTTRTRIQDLGLLVRLNKPKVSITEQRGNEIG